MNFDDFHIIFAKNAVGRNILEISSKLLKIFCKIPQQKKMFQWLKKKLKIKMRTWIEFNSPVYMPTMLAINWINGFFFGKQSKSKPKLAWGTLCFEQILFTTEMHTHYTYNFGKRTNNKRDFIMSETALCLFENSFLFHSLLFL